MITSFFLCIMPLLSACTPQTYPPVSITDAIRDISDNLSKFHTVGMLDVSLWSPEKVSAFKDSIRAEQCRQHTSDPIIITLRDSILLKLTGQFSTTGSFTVGASGAALPSIGASGSRTQGHEQELDVPIYMTPLSTLADYTSLHKMDMYKPGRNENDHMRDTNYGKSMQASHALLQSIVQESIDAYPSVLCAPKAQDNPSVLFGTKKPK